VGFFLNIYVYAVLFLDHLNVLTLGLFEPWFEHYFNIHVPRHEQNPLNQVNQVQDAPNGPVTFNELAVLDEMRLFRLKCQLNYYNSNFNILRAYEGSGYLFFDNFTIYVNTYVHAFSEIYRKQGLLEHLLFCKERSLEDFRIAQEIWHMRCQDDTLSYERRLNWAYDISKEMFNDFNDSVDSQGNLRYEDLLVNTRNVTRNALINRELLLESPFKVQHRF
jgi:hypothetical protein